MLLLLLPLMADSSVYSALNESAVDVFSGDLLPDADIPTEDGYALPGYYAYKYQWLPDWLTLGGSVRNRFEYMDGQFRRGLRDYDRQWPIRARLFFSIHDRFDPIRFTFEYQDSKAYLTQANSNVGTSQMDENEIQQLHIDWYSENFAQTGLVSDLQLGRVNMDLGEGRWIARNNFRNSTNAYDGIYWKLGAKPQELNADVFAVYPVDIFLKSMNPFFKDNTNFMWGTYLLLPPFQSFPWLRLELDFLRHRSKAAHRDFDMLGLSTFKEASPKDWFFDFESQFQLGDIGPDTHFAQFYHFAAGYSFQSRWKPQVSILFDYASGGFDILYGRRSFELAPTGILGPFQRSNILSTGFRFMINPTENFNIYLQQRFTRLQNARFPWVDTGLWDPEGVSGRTLGSTTELRAYWLLQTNVLLEAGYFYFDYGRFPKTAPYTPVTQNTNYAFVQLEIVF